MEVYRRTRIPGLIDPSVIATIGDVELNSVSSESGGGVDTMSWNHVVASGQNRLLLVTVGSTEGTSLVTYGGVSLTKFNETFGGGTVGVSVWYLVNPVVGTDTVTVTPAAANDYMEAGSIDFRNVNQSTPLASYVGNQGIDGAPTVTLTGATGDLAIGWIKYWWLWNFVSVGTGMVSLYNETSDNAWSTSGARKAGAASIVLAWTVSTDAEAIYAGVVIKKG